MHILHSVIFKKESFAKGRKRIGDQRKIAEPNGDDEPRRPRANAMTDNIKDENIINKCNMNCQGNWIRDRPMRKGEKGRTGSGKSE